MCLFNDELRLRFLLKRIRMKIISRKFQRFFAKFFGDSARDVICKVPLFAIENAHEKRQDNFSFFFFFYLHNFAKTCSYGLTILKNVAIYYLYHIKEYFHVLDSFYSSCRSAFELLQ